MVTVRPSITAVDDRRRRLKADGFLSVDGRAIYQMNDFTLGLDAGDPMKYAQRSIVDAIGYELPPVVVTSAELEARLAPFYEALHIPAGQLEALTGIVERRWWETGYPLSRRGDRPRRGTRWPAREVRPDELDVLIYAGVCRELFEPATACRVAAGLGVSPDAAVYDLSNACLGVLNGMVDVANRIELGQIRAGLVVSCETAREINDIMIERMLASRSRWRSSRSRSPRSPAARGRSRCS